MNHFFFLVGVLKIETELVFKEFLRGSVPIFEFSLQEHIHFIRIQISFIDALSVLEADVRHRGSDLNLLSTPQHEEKGASGEDCPVGWQLQELKDVTNLFSIDVDEACFCLVKGVQEYFFDLVFLKEVEFGEVFERDADGLLSSRYVLPVKLHLDRLEAQNSVEVVSNLNFFNELDRIGRGHSFSLQIPTDISFRFRLWLPLGSKATRFLLGKSINPVALLIDVIALSDS